MRFDLQEENEVFKDFTVISQEESHRPTSEEQEVDHFEENRFPKVMRIQRTVPRLLDLSKDYVQAVSEWNRGKARWLVRVDSAKLQRTLSSIKTESESGS